MRLIIECPFVGIWKFNANGFDRVAVRKQKPGGCVVNIRDACMILIVEDNFWRPFQDIDLSKERLVGL